MSDKSSFALVIPCYNEEKAIPLFFSELCEFSTQFLQLFPQSALQIIIVDNNSNDGSWESLNAFATNIPTVRLMKCPQPGYGAAIKAGLISVEADFFGFADLDHTYPLLDFLPMFARILNNSGKVDMISGGRLNATSKIPWVRRLGNKFYSVVTRTVFLNCSINDICSGMRIFKGAQRPQVLKLKKNDLSFSIELTAHALKNNWKLEEFQIVYRERLGRSKLLVLEDGFKFLHILIKTKFSHARPE